MMTQAGDFKILKLLNMEWTSSFSEYQKKSITECTDLVASLAYRDELIDNIAVQVSSGRVLAEDVISPTNVPDRPTSILDGFAVRSGASQTRYCIIGSSLAGQSDCMVSVDDPAFCLYASTGGAIPDGADCVIPIESCEIAANYLTVDSAFKPVPGSNIRQPGSDTTKGSVIVGKGTQIGAGDIALLTACKVTVVKVYRKTRVAVLSTGAEIVSGLVGDANRAFLLNRLTRYQDFANIVDVIDLGAIEDDKSSFSAVIQRSDYDVLITTGSVSKGQTDLMKAVLEAHQFDVLFGQVDLKPGKPTTVAVKKESGIIVFALPGNPASGFVTFNLFVLPYLYKAAGITARQLEYVRITLSGGPPSIQPDLDRPEYLRAMAYVTQDGQLEATLVEGHQRSSRIASCSGNVNCLVRIEPGLKSIFVREHLFEAILLPGCSVPTRPLSAKQASSVSEAAKAKAFDSLVEWLKIKNDVENIELMNLAGFCRNCLSKWLHAGSGGSTSLDDSKRYVYGMDYEEWKRLYRKGEKRDHAPRIVPPVASNPCASSIDLRKNMADVYILTVSDRAHVGVYADESGPMAEATLLRCGLGFNIRQKQIVPDEMHAIQQTVKEWISSSVPTLIIILGGTGFTERDVTPEAIAPLIMKAAPGIVHLILSCYIAKDPMHAMTRLIAGATGKTLIITLPGRPTAVKDGLECLAPLLPKLMLDLDR